MESRKQWKYKIGSGLTGVVLSLIMLAIFGGITIWLHTTRNGAVLLGVILTVIMLAVFLVALYRAVFYKVLIGKDGFYYQTTPANGKHYDYAEIEKAWLSSGTEHNGAQSDYCNIAAHDGNIIRFPFYPADSDSVEYLLERVSEKKGNAGDDDREYLINGRVYGKASIFIAFVLLAVVTVLDVVIAQYGKIHFLTVPGIVMAATVLLILIVRYFCFKVQIGNKGFYYRTTPFNGQYYEYSEIVDCKEIKKVYRHRNRGIGSSHRSYYFYFTFTDVRGKTSSFQFEKPIFEHEVNVLKARIENTRP